MEISAYIILLILMPGLKAQTIEVNDATIKKNAEYCKKLAEDPYFDADLVVGNWRVYHTWNMNLETKCLDITFKHATPEIIHRIWSDMFDYMEQQPGNWESAALLLTVNMISHEVLLFPAQGGAGEFVGVPNVIRSGDLTPVKNGVHLMKLQLKLIQHGKFLMITDCHIGITNLAARSTHHPYRSEIAEAVANLNIGDGFPSCVREKNKDEQQFFAK